jgi:hypothetical protein
MSEYHDTVKRWLFEQGAIDVCLTRGKRSKHPRINFVWRGQQLRLTLSCTPGKEWNAVRAAITQARHLMGLVGGEKVGGEKVVGERREPRRREKFEARAVNDPSAQMAQQFQQRGGFATLGDVWPGMRA